jgi:peptidoglycan/LPS O-acetylase OafA/YrhL
MDNRFARVRRILPVSLGAVTLACAGVLFAWDAFPARFPPGTHEFLAAFSLAMIGIAYLAFQFGRRPAPAELLKAILLAAAFFFWAANQFWPERPQATLFNDIAVALFVLDIFLGMIGRPAASPAVSGGATFEEAGREKRG